MEVGLYEKHDADQTRHMTDHNQAPWVTPEMERMFGSGYTVPREHDGDGVEYLELRIYCPTPNSMDKSTKEVFYESGESITLEEINKEIYNYWKSKHKPERVILVFNWHYSTRRKKEEAKKFRITKWPSRPLRDYDTKTTTDYSDYPDNWSGTDLFLARFCESERRMDRLADVMDRMLRVAEVHSGLLDEYDEDDEDDENEPANDAAPPSNDELTAIITKLSNQLARVERRLDEVQHDASHKQQKTHG